MDATEGLSDDNAQSISAINDAIEAERLLIVVGAGVSMSATNTAEESYWDGLLKLGLTIISDSEKRRLLSDLLMKQQDSKSAIFVAEDIRTIL